MGRLSHSKWTRLRPPAFGLGSPVNNNPILIKKEMISYSSTWPLSTGTKISHIFSNAHLDLCPDLTKNILPLTVLKEGHQTLRYDGFVTVQGLMSFMRFHDPATSGLTSVFVEDSDLIEPRFNRFQDVGLDNPIEKARRSKVVFEDISV